MVKLEDRISWWVSRTNYLGHSVSATEINNAVVCDLVIYAKNGSSAIERMERWVIPGATKDDYLTKTAYKRSFVLTNKIGHYVSFGRRRWSR